MTAHLESSQTLSPASCGILGQSRALLVATRQAERVARSGMPVLLMGATGTGKELFARYVHELSGRRGELVDLNCGALPSLIAQSLLFGHRKGSFTGAIRDSVGLFSRASGGTLFLDELPSLDRDVQAALLRVLETKQFKPLGATSNVSVDFRLVSAVQDDLASRLESGTFREDLYHRVAGAVIHIPPLSERDGDLELLACRFASEHGRTLAGGALSVLERYHWPGNIRELRSVIERATLLTDSMTLDEGCLREALAHGVAKGTGANAAHTPELPPSDLYLLCVANDCDPRRIAAAMGVSRATLYRHLGAEGLSLRFLAKSQKSQRSHSG
jgi:transcriptional regulator with PAS, ATPase and Fis domain